MKAQPFVITEFSAKTVFVLALYHKLQELQKIACSISAAKGHIDSMISQAAHRDRLLLTKKYETSFVNPYHFDVTINGEVVLSVKDKSLIQPETITIPNRITV